MKLLDAVNMVEGKIPLNEELRITDSRIEIPNCCREDLPQLFVELGFKVGAEIGVDRGYFSNELCKAGLTVYSVDPWLHHPRWRYHKTQEQMDEIYKSVCELLAPYGEKSIIIKETSMEAVEKFKDESLDFVYIDGNHQFRYVAEDIYEWNNKVRRGGIISGHDYFTPTQRKTCAVQPVLHAYVSWFDVKPWYVLGSKRKRAPGDARERFRSWMWFKK